MDANELLSLKILKDANPTAFSSLAKEETKWLSLALGLLRKDPYLQVMMQGKGVRQAMRLSGLLKQKAEQFHFNSRVDPVVSRVVKAKFLEDGWGSLQPALDNEVKSMMKASSGGLIVSPLSKEQFQYGSDSNYIDLTKTEDINNIDLSKFKPNFG